MGKHPPKAPFSLLPAADASDSDFSTRVEPSLIALDFKPAVMKGEAAITEIGLMLARARKDGTWIIICKMATAMIIFPQGLKTENRRITMIFNSPTQTNDH